MVSLLLAIIYVAFISLGLPDSLLGAAWPVIYVQFGVPVSAAGLVSMIICGGTIVSSLLSDRVVARFGTGVVTAVSVALTALALHGFSLSSSFWMLCLCAIPYGLGAGGVDAGLNNYVALHFTSRHMNWLHCFWGVGTIIGPTLMGFCLTRSLSWNTGYRTVALIQTILSFLLFLSLPLWKKVKRRTTESAKTERTVHGIRDVLALPGAKPIMVAFFCYCALEVTTGLWASSYLVLTKGVPEARAAKLAALFYLGITLGRFLSGLVSDRMGDGRMVILGLAVVLAGLLLLLLPLPLPFSFMGLVLTGIGCAPIYPSLLHATPDNFGEGNSQAIMGMQMASAYVGSTFAPPLFGLLAGAFGTQLLPAALSVYLLGMAAMTRLLGKRKGKT